MLNHVESTFISLPHKSFWTSLYSSGSFSRLLAVVRQQDLSVAVYYVVIAFAHHLPFSPSGDSRAIGGGVLQTHRRFSFRLDGWPEGIMDRS